MENWNSSYIYGEDETSGWGGRYFFTYFSEFGDGQPDLRTVLEVAILVAVFVVSVVANVAIAMCVFRYPDMRTVTNCFVLNLAAADLIFVISAPVVAATRVISTWKMGDVACRLVPYTQFVSGIVLLWTLALISIDRHRCIVVPPYRSKITPRQAFVFSLIIWLLTAVLFTPVLLWFRQQSGEGGRVVCTLVFPKSEAVNYSICFMVPLVVFACLLPMTMLVYHYQRIFKKIISTRNTWASSCVMVSSGGGGCDVKQPHNGGCPRSQARRQSELSLSDIFVPWPWPRRSSSAGVCANGGAAAPRQGSLSQQEELRVNKHVKVVRVLFLNVVVVLIMWLPITAVMVLIYVDGRRPNDDKNYFLRSHHFVISLTIAYANTLVNPLLYGVLSDSFRACLAKTWCPGRLMKSATDRTEFIRETVTPSSGRNQGAKVSKRPSISDNREEDDLGDIV